MHFGPIRPLKDVIKFTSVIFLLFFLSCRDKNELPPVFVYPLSGDNIVLGTNFYAKISVPDPENVNEVEYLLDEKLIKSVKGLDSIALSTANLRLGHRIITAIVKRKGTVDTISTNIVLSINKAPNQLKYKVVNSFPHQTTAYTQGLSYVDGRLLESTGEKGSSVLKYVDLKSGRDLQQVKLPSTYFGEGSVKIGDKVIMLTWQENIGLIFDAKTFKQLGTFPYEKSREGWGLTYDGKHMLRSDGSNRIWFMNANTYKEEDFLEVYDFNGAVNELNELEYINGKIFANVYGSSKIIQINTLSGAVEAEIDLSALVPRNFFKTSEEELNNVLNGIAWDEKGKRLFVTGKKWPKLYEIKLIK